MHLHKRGKVRENCSVVSFSLSILQQGSLLFVCVCVVYPLFTERWSGCQRANCCISRFAAVGKMGKMLMTKRPLRTPPSCPNISTPGSRCLISSQTTNTSFLSCWSCLVFGVSCVYVCSTSMVSWGVGPLAVTFFPLLCLNGRCVLLLTHGSINYTDHVISHHIPFCFSLPVTIAPRLNEFYSHATFRLSIAVHGSFNDGSSTYPTAVEFPGT